MGQSMSPPRRKLRNYLLDRRFQLKYTGMVVAVTVVIAAVLGGVAYSYSRGQTEALSIQIAMQPDLHPEVGADLERWAQAQDQRVLLAIILGIFILAATLGLTGIVVTHRLVGPAYKLKMLFREVGEGKLRIAGGIRKNDELQDVFEAFSQMVEALRSRKMAWVDELSQVQQRLSADKSEEALRDLQLVIERLRREAEGEG